MTDGQVALIATLSATVPTALAKDTSWDGSLWRTEQLTRSMSGLFMR